MASKGPLAGIQVVEMASFLFVPTAGAMLSDWGAEVIKIEHPEHGDPMRGLQATSQSGHRVPTNASFQAANRGKRSVAVDVGTANGRAALGRLVAGADVFLTNLLPAARRNLAVDVEDLQQHNQRLIYARGSGFGPRGPHAERGGFDFATYWSRGGIATSFMERNPSLGHPPRQVGGFGDLPAGALLAGGVAAALAGREVTGNPAVVDVSLVGLAAWQMSLSVVHGVASDPTPCCVTASTNDDRFLAVVVPASTEEFARMCSDLGAGDLPALATFATADLRRLHVAELRAALAACIARRSLDEWRVALWDVPWAWDPVQTVAELVRDPQTLANRYLLELPTAEGTLPAVSNPIHFDEEPPELLEGPADLGGSTDDVLLELGYTWDELIAMKLDGSIL